MSSKLPNHELLNELFEYRDGFLINKPRSQDMFDTRIGFASWTKRYVGKIAGAARRDGYIQLSIAYKLFLAHRVIYSMMNNIDISDYEIDHINGIRDDNRIENLRLATRQENARNMCLTKRNSSGIKGVFFDTRKKSYEAGVATGGGSIKRTFSNIIDAEKWVLSKREQLHKDFANNG